MFFSTKQVVHIVTTVNERVSVLRATLIIFFNKIDSDGLF